MLNSIIGSSITITGLLICLISALVLGILNSLLFSYKNCNSKSLTLTLAILPLAMAMITMMVNGNLGLAISVAGGFTLVRFRTIAGTGKEISAVFISMTLGVITGMGYIIIAIIFFAIVAIAYIALVTLNFGAGNNFKVLKITIPEDYDYETLFNDVFEKYNIHAELKRVKTTNLGSLIEVSYQLQMPDAGIKKQFLDDLRAKNSNLSIIITSEALQAEQL